LPLILDLDPQASEQIGAIQLAERVLESVSAPILFEGSSVEVGASIGIALFPGDGADPEAMLRAADIAMYGAKGTARRIRFFEASLDADLRARAALESAVRRAVLVSEIKSYYQPLIDLSDGQVMGFEILARWRHPERGPVSPEVTESAGITDLETARTIIQSLQRLGIRVALDDFGTG
jgi:predicted signal transduction protein with EAL and GGDEF domain